MAPATKTKAAPKKAPVKRAVKRGRPKKAAPKPPSRAQLLERDPWHFLRLEDPDFIAIVQVLEANPQLTFYSVEWRPFLFGAATSPFEAMLLKANDGKMTSTSETRSRGHAGGFRERFAGSVIDFMAGDEHGWTAQYPPLDERTYRKVSDAIVVSLQKSYERDLAHRRFELSIKEWDQDGRFVGQRPRKVSPRRARTFKQLLREAGFTPGVLNKFDREAAKQRALLAAG